MEKLSFFIMTFRILFSITAKKQPNGKNQTQQLHRYGKKIFHFDAPETGCSSRLKLYH
jgi:hypothetical protein